MAPTGPGSRDNRGRGKEAKEVLAWRALSELVDLSQLDGNVISR